jgi:hypothetical protein
LNVYVPHLQSVGAVVGYLRFHRGQRFASTTAVTPMTEAFVRNIEQFINHEGVDLVAFQKWQRKDDVTQKYLRRFTQCEGVLYVGKAQEKADGEWAFSTLPVAAHPGVATDALVPVRTPRFRWADLTCSCPRRSLRRR